VEASDSQCEVMEDWRRQLKQTSRNCGAKQLQRCVSEGVLVDGSETAASSSGSGRRAFSEVFA
jgi:hypothetical protein